MIEKGWRMVLVFVFFLQLKIASTSTCLSLVPLGNDVSEEAPKNRRKEGKEEGSNFTEPKHIIVSVSVETRKRRWEEKGRSE